MDTDSSRPGSPGAALQPLSPDRVNQQRDSVLFSSLRTDSARDSSVHDKIHQFNSLAMQSKHLERKTADAALKRAMLGREEAEGEMRRYREEARALRRQVEEGRERERKVGERLEQVMENYGRAKETHAHTQALWEKEIRRARKETFKSQSASVKLQEELKSSKSTLKSTEETLQREKERSRSREQEAFQARYAIVGVQEQLDQALERVKVLEQERDTFKTLAKEEEVARIAAEGQLPLPPPTEKDDEFSSPQKKTHRVSSISVADIQSSAASEAEIEELTRLWQWEKQKADRATERVEFLEVECLLRCCPCNKPRSRTSAMDSARKKRSEPVPIADPSDLLILGVDPASPTHASESGPATKKVKLEEDDKIEEPKDGEPTEAIQPPRPKEQAKKEPRRSTIFIPSEGTFRTVSQEEAEAMEVVQEAEKEPTNEAPTEPSTPADANPPFFARTPSVEPPTFAMLGEQRASLLSLLDAPHQEQPPLAFHVPTTPASTVHPVKTEQEEDSTPTPKIDPPAEEEVSAPVNAAVNDENRPPVDMEHEEICRPHTSASFYRTATTTTMVPLRAETTEPNLASKLMQLQRTPSAGSNHSSYQPTFDVNNPALTPTMTREQALAQIRERRGRARSGAVTPRRQMVEGAGERRDVSAPAGRPASRMRS